MSHEKLRHRIAWEAARLLFYHPGEEIYQAKLIAARKFTRERLGPDVLPSQREIQQQLRAYQKYRAELAAVLQDRERQESLLNLLRVLESFHPLLFQKRFEPPDERSRERDRGPARSREKERSVARSPEKAIRTALSLFCDEPREVFAVLERAQFPHEILSAGTWGMETSFLVTLAEHDRLPVVIHPKREFREYSDDDPARGITLEEFESLLEDLVATQSHREGHSAALEEEVAFSFDRFQLYASLLAPLEKVRQNPKTHPEGDLLYHSLQVFALAREEHPYDEEFLLAALLHDVGRGIDSQHAIPATLAALEGGITPRVAWLIEHLSEGHALRDKTIGTRARRRLEESEDYETLLTLAECDKKGRRPGVAVPDLGEAIQYLKELSEQCDEE